MSISLNEGGEVETDHCADQSRGEERSPRASKPLRRVVVAWAKDKYPERRGHGHGGQPLPNDKYGYHTCQKCLIE